MTKRILILCLTFSLFFTVPANATELDDYIREIGPTSLTIRYECRVVRQEVEETDYVVCLIEGEPVWRQVKEDNKT